MWPYFPLPLPITPHSPIRKAVPGVLVRLQFPAAPPKKKKKKNIASTISFLFGLTEAYLKKCFHVTPEPHVLHQACPVPPLKYTLCHKPYRLNHLLYFFSKEHNRKRCESPLGAAKYKTGWDILKLSLKADWGKHMDYSRC